MVKIDLLREVSRQASENSEVRYTQADVENIITAYSAVILEAIKNEDKIPMPGLGAWGRKFIKGREGVSALTGKAFKTADKYVLEFKPSKVNKVIQ